MPALSLWTGSRPPLASVPRVTDPGEYIEALATVNRNGFGFLLAYGLTWSIAGLLWRTKGERVGAYAALFQGMVALPLALGVTAATAVGTRPDDATMSSLSFFLAAGQLMMLPLVIVLVMARHHTVAVAVMAVVTAIHFFPYSWLYGTVLYVAIGLVIGVTTAVLMGRENQRAGSAGALICGTTGGTLLLGAIAALFL